MTSVRANPMLHLKAEQETVLPATLPDASRPVPPRRRIRGVSSTDKLNFIGAVASGLCVALLLFGRLAPGISLEQARAELNTVYGAMLKDHREAYPAQAHFQISAPVFLFKATMVALLPPGVQMSASPSTRGDSA